MKYKPLLTQKSKTYYRNDIEYLEDQFCLIDLLMERKRIKEIDEDKELYRTQLWKILKKIDQQSKQIEKRRNCSLEEHELSFGLDQITERYHLDENEKKVLVFLLYKYFTSDSVGSSGRLVLESITEDRLSMMQARPYLMENGKLYANRLIHCQEMGSEGSILDFEFSLPEEIISHLLGEKKIGHATRRIKKSQEKSYKNYLNLYFSLLQMMEKKAEISMVIRSTNSSETGVEDWETSENSKELGRIRYSIRKAKASLLQFRNGQDQYPLEKVSKEYGLSWDEKLILVFLLRDSLGLSDSFMGCEGKKLLAIISETESEMIAKRALLYKESKLRANNLIEMEKGWNGQNVLDAEYFLSEKMIRKLLGHLNEESLIEEELNEEGEEANNILSTVVPRFSFGDVILSEIKKKAIEIALSQQINHDLIFGKWGFGKRIPYGNALTMLFSGPPGTGKTMMAEAIAHHLGKKLLIANYARIQNLYVGETEKRILSTFRKAKQEQGVLLWDEADAMFYSRDIASQSWESRDVNVILQELERFEGVVILTTNRKVALDKALDRRLALKISFDMPDEKDREKIWKTLIPPEALGEETIDFALLAREYEVSGGSIKNGILNAARYAAYRQSPHLTMGDLIYGVKTEMESGSESQVKIGFGK